MDYYAGNGLAISGNLPKRKELVGPLAEMERDYKRFKAVDEEHFNGEGYESEEEEEDNVPNPYAVSNFRISDVVARQLKSKGIETLFPIQALTFDAIYEGNDLVGRAHTGQGKTLAFVLPILESLMKSGAWNSQKRKKGRAPSVLILAPTRELAKQVHDDFEFYGSVIGISTVCVYGGAPYPPQAAAMRAGVDVVVGTPGRIKDHLERGTLNLKMLKFRILDEADEMLNMGFVDDVEKILGHVEDASSVQTLLFSATMPDWVQKIASRFLKDTKEVVDLVGDEKMKACASVRHLLLPCLKSARNQLVMDVISCYSSGGRTIVFTERKNEASDLAGILPGTARALHGDIPQSQREVTLSGFRSGKFSILVATDVAARGLDITDVQLIIQCEPAKDAETYIHRSGRTGRAGKTGISVMFYSKKKEHLIPIIEKKAGFKFEKISAPQPADLARASAIGAAESIMAVSDGLLPIFRPAAEELVQKSGLSLIDVVAKAIAKVAGHTELRRRSLLSGQEGFATMMLELGKLVHTLTSMVDLNMVTRLDPLRTYPYRYRAAEEKRRLRSLHQVIEDLLSSPDQNDELIVWRSVAGLEDGRSRILLPLFSFHLRNGGFPVTRRTELSKKQRQHSTLPLQVFVKMLNGSTCIVRVGHADSIASLFSTVSAKEGVPVCLLRLIFAGKQLDGGKSIKDYDIAQDSSISVVLRLRGGMSGRPKSSKGQSALSGRKLLYSEANATSSKPDARVHENPVFQEEILAKEVSEANSWDIDGKISKSDRDSAMLEIIQADKRGFPSLQEAFEANRGSPNKPPVKSRRLDISMDVDLLVVDKDAELMEDVVLETQQPGGNMDCVQQPVPRKSAWGKPPGSNDWSFLGHKTDDYEAIKSSMLKDCKAAFISKRDFLFPEGHTRRVLKAPVAITADQLCTRYIELSECGLFFYFMGRVPFEDDFKRWFKATFQGRCLIKQIKWIGRGFYQVIVGSIQQRDFILGSAVGFNGNFVYTIPWRANFNPADLLAHECPVWVSFPKLSPLLEDEVESIAETLGKVLYVGKGRRACVLWNREKEPPEFLELTTSDGLDLIVEVSFATFPDSCFLCKQAGHFARFCPMAENRKATYAAASGRVPTKPDAEVNLSDKVNAVVTPPLCTMEGSVQEGKGKNKAIPDFFHKSLQNKEVSQDSVAEVLGSDKVNGSGQVVPQSEFTVVQGNKNKGFPSGPRGNTRRSQGSQGRRTIRDFVNKFAALEDDYGLVHVLEDVEPTSPSLKNEGGGPF